MRKHYEIFSFPVSVVEHEMSAPATDPADSSALPDWAIAVIVIGLGSFAFVLVFGITVVRALFFAFLLNLIISEQQDKGKFSEQLLLACSLTHEQNEMEELL